MEPKYVFIRIRDLCNQYLDDYEANRDKAKAFAETIDRLIEVSGLKEKHEKKDNP